ncbi:hypothetical protein KKH36_02590 [Patescibacteria group bacterium]|nr:hypothetical protein [Patescibacteria group bacterium]
MKKEYLIQLFMTLIIGIFLGYTFSGNISKEKISTEDSSNTLFDKREKCANYREQAKNQLNETYKIATPYFYDIFYSSKLDTCLYTHGLELFGTPPNESGSFVIVDYFSGDEIFSVDYDNSSTNEDNWSYNQRPNYSKEVEKYKN